MCSCIRRHKLNFFTYSRFCQTVPTSSWNSPFLRLVFPSLLSCYISALSIPNSPFSDHTATPPVVIPPYPCACVLSCFSCIRLFATLWLYATRLLCPWDSPDKDTGMGCHALLHPILVPWPNIHASVINVRGYSSLICFIFAQYLKNKGKANFYLYHLRCSNSMSSIIYLPLSKFRVGKSELFVKVCSRFWGMANICKQLAKPWMKVIFIMTG